MCTSGSVFDHCLEHCPQGADNVIFERLANGMDDVRKVTREHLEHFGSSGLRTLCLAYKDLNPETYDSWNEKFIQAKSALRDREKKLDEVYYNFLPICILLFVNRSENDFMIMSLSNVNDCINEYIFFSRPGNNL